ncbi:hypothetical protein EFA69_07755 [Rufibacter immobilis]|uniref:Uncharacterized protein n=1 Tax=Rufibacter immobilis TaxID=1348778 RepID=A0A3M9MWG5_9BACT|nr:hypothetical protein EFA69_07755 [Rufibacter immobilis]
MFLPLNGPVQNISEANKEALAKKTVNHLPRRRNTRLEGTAADKNAAFSFDGGINDYRLPQRSMNFLSEREQVGLLRFLGTFKIRHK